MTVRNGKSHGGGGGGILNRGDLTLTDSAVTDNTAVNGQGGGIFNNLGTLTVENSIVKGNVATGDVWPGYGGGISNWGGSLTVIRSLVSQNRATSHRLSPVRGGGISSFMEGDGPKPKTTIVASVIELNVSDQGVGITQQEGELSISDTIVRDNSGRFSGGLWMRYAATTLKAVTISGNTGGGILISAATIRVENSTLSGNTGAFKGAGIEVGGGGLAILSNSTVTANTADDRAGGVYTSATGNTVVFNSVVFGNSAPRQPNCNELTSRGYNLLPAALDCAFTPTTTDILQTDPQLGPLQDNGGLTLTHALLSTSPAIDAGNPAPLASGGEACHAVDQRGMSRLMDGDGDGVARCDIGAFELVAAPQFQKHAVTGDVVLEGMPTPISGARVTFSGDSVVKAVTSDPASGNFQIQLPPGTYAVTIEKDGFLKATKRGLVVNKDMVPASRQAPLGGC